MGISDSPQTVRYAPREQSWEPPADSAPEAAAAIERHIERHFGPISSVWHELVSDLVHIDVHFVAPTPERPLATLVTSGMSDRPMTVPEGAGPDHRPYAELMMSLPADWPLTQEALKDERAYWPLRLLKTIARLPHEYRTWIGPWHSLPNGDPAESYAPGMPFVATLVTPMIKCTPEARVIDAPGKEISLLSLVPLHPAELELKLTEGAAALLDPFDEVGVSEVFAPDRPSSI